MRESALYALVSQSNARMRRGRLGQGLVQQLALHQYVKLETGSEIAMPRLVVVTTAIQTIRNGRTGALAHLWCVSSQIYQLFSQMVRL